MSPHITIFGFLIAEPTTAITDFILAFLCLVFYYRFTEGIKENGVFYWKLFFLFMGISTLIGGFTHAFFTNLHSSSYIAFWLTMQLFSGLSVYYAQLATIYSIPNVKIPMYRSVNKSVWVCRIQFFVFALLTIYMQNFIVVVVNTTIGFLMVLYIHALSGKKYGNRPAGWIAMGITISFLTAIVYTLKISVNEWFNFKDIAHLIMMVSIYLIFYGVGLYFKEESKEEAAEVN